MCMYVRKHTYTHVYMCTPVMDNENTMYILFLVFLLYAIRDGIKQGILMEVLG